MSHRKITAILTARAGQSEALRALLLDMIDDCRAEPGCLRWDIWQDPSQDGRHILDELYVDDAAIAAHRETPHFKIYASKIGELAEREAIVLQPVDVAP